MSDNETIADIVADMRSMGNYQSYSGDHARKLADRIEAAWKREIQAVSNRNGLGNAAKMRDALLSSRKKLANIKPGDFVAGVLIEVIATADAALALPPRNCDRFATADEALKAHKAAYEEDNFKNGECKLGCPGCDEFGTKCEVRWLFAVAKEESEAAR